MYKVPPGGLVTTAFEFSSDFDGEGLDRGESGEGGTSDDKGKSNALLEAVAVLAYKGGLFPTSIVSKLVEGLGVGVDRASLLHGAEGSFGFVLLVGVEKVGVETRFEGGKVDGGLWGIGVTFNFRVDERLGPLASMASHEGGGKEDLAGVGGKTLGVDGDVDTELPGEGLGGKTALAVELVGQGDGRRVVGCRRGCGGEFLRLDRMVMEIMNFFSSGQR